jgi:hypothetical protein
MKNNGGYIAISVVLILLVVTIGISSSILFLSSGKAKIYDALREGDQALFRSDACLEEGLLRLKADPVNYAGGNVSFPDGTCHVSIDNQSGTYTLQVFFSSSDSYWRSIEAKAQVIDGIIQMTSWSEKPLVVE